MKLISFGYASADAVAGDEKIQVSTVQEVAPLRPPSSSAKKRSRWTPAMTEAVAKKWAPVFQVPVSTVMSFVDIESSHDPKKVNMARFDKGGAWGLGQQMLDEADEKVHRIKHAYGKQFPQVNVTSKKWRGDPANLLDPDLNMMLSAWQLGRLNKEFGGDFRLVAAAYHQGEYAVKRRLSQGLPAVGKAQPQGLQYVSMAEEARKKYEPQSPVPAMYYTR